jgi:hypothetical protein
MKRPAVVWIVAIIAGTSVLLNVLELLATLSAVNRWPWGAILGQMVQSAGSAVVSAWMLRSIVQGTFNSRLSISLYLWFLLIIYPIRHVLANVGLGLVETTQSPRELLGAAIAEILRYVALITLIVWVAASKALRSYLLEKSGPLVA